MDRTPAPPAAHPCIWMTAGLVQYRLCDREFDCDRCPLDAALRGEPAAAQPELPAGTVPPPIVFPTDRQYTRGHTWVQRRNGSTRVGIDALAAALAGPPDAVRWLSLGAPMAEGDALCALDLPWGTLPLASPLRGGAPSCNPALDRNPELVAGDPYGGGWLIDLPADGPPGPLLDAGAVREATRLDLRHFRRRVALDLLGDLDLVGATLADGGEALTDLRRMLGPRHYLALVRELVH